MTYKKENFSNRFKSYLDRIVENRRQLCFLSSILAFTLSVISIVFGVNSNVLDEYIRSEEKHNFQTIPDIVSFPIQQHKSFNQNAKKIEISSGHNKKVSHIQIVDATVNSQSFKNFQFKKFKEILGDQLTIDRDKIKIEDLICVIGFCLKKVQKPLKSTINPNFFFMKGCENEENPQALFNPPDEEFTSTDINKGVLDVFRNNLKELKPGMNAKSRFDLVIEGLIKIVEDRTVITIISDFNEEDNELSLDLKTSLDKLKREKPNIKFNLFELDPGLATPKDNSGEVINAIKRRFAVEHINLSQQGLVRNINSTKIKSLLSFNSPEKPKLVLAPSTPKENRENGYREYLSHSELNLKLDTGKYIFHFEADYKKDGLKLIVENETYSLIPGIDRELIVNSEAKISYQGQDYGETIGFLKIFSERQMSNQEFLLVQKRILNFPTVGFSMLCYTFLFIAIGCIFYILITCINSGETNNLISIPLSAITVIIMMLLSYSTEGFIHYIQHLVLPFWQFYCIIVVILGVFAIIRYYEKNHCKKTESQDTSGVSTDT